MLTKTLKYVLLYLTFYFSNLILSAQNQKIDSLQNILMYAEEDTNKVKVLNEIGDFYLYYFPPKAILYSNKALMLSISLNYKSGAAQSYLNLGLASYRKDEYIKTKECYEKALNIFENTKNILGKGNCYFGLAEVYSGMGDFELGTEYCIRALKIFEENNYQIGEGRAYAQLGWFNLSLKNHLTALKNLEKSINILAEINDVQLGEAYRNKGNVYQELGKEDSAVFNYNMSVYFSRKLFNRNSESYALNNLGKYYFDHREYSKAMDYFNNSLLIDKAHNNYYGMCRNMIGIGEIYFKNGRNGKALVFINKSLEISKKINDLDGLQQTYYLGYQIYEKMADNTKALAYHKLYSEYKDSVFNMAISINVSKTQMGFENEKVLLINQKEREKEQAVTAEESKKQKIIIWSVVCGLLFVVLFAAYIYLNLRITRKQKNIIETQKVEVEKLHNIIEEKNKDITDSINYAKRIQRAMLPHRSDIWAAFPQSFVLFKPKDIVSGDFYFFLQKQSISFYCSR